MNLRDGIVKWALPSGARVTLTAALSAIRLSPSPERTKLAGAIGCALYLGPRETLDDENRALLVQYAASCESAGTRGERVEIGRAVLVLLACVATHEQSDPEGPSRTSSTDARAPSSFALVRSVACGRCGLTPYKSAVDGVLSCASCGHRPTSDDPAYVRRVIAEREARQARVAWLVGPVRHLASLSLAREEILNRAGSFEEQVGDGARLEAVDQQIDQALHGPRSEEFLRAIGALADIVDLARSWGRAGSDESAGRDVAEPGVVG